MENKAKLDKIFMECLGVESAQLNDELDVLSVDCWDSVMQMRLVSEIEDSFDVMFDPEDIIEFTSYSAIFTILKRLGVEV